MQYPTVDRVMEPMELTARLAKMSTDQLRTYAQMHSDDANVVALALAESKRRQAMQPHPQMNPQPTVLEQTLGQMGQQAKGEQVELPEDVGIGQLPAQNIEHMADGGIVAFSRGGDAGSDPKSAYKQYARKRAAEAGLDPDMVDALFEHESGYNPTIVSPKKAVGIGQLMPDTARGHGLSKEDMVNPYKNIDASIAELSQLNRKYQGDKTKILNAYNWGQGNLDKQLASKNPDARPPETVKHQGVVEKLMASMAPAATATEATPAPNLDTTSPGWRDLSTFLFGDAKAQANNPPKAAANTSRISDKRRQEMAARQDERDAYWSGTDADYKLAQGRRRQVTYPGQGSHAQYDVELAQQGIKPEDTVSAAPAVPPMHPSSGYDPTNAWDDLNARAEAPEKAPAAAAAPEEKSWLDNMTGNDWMNLGLAFLKNRSPYWQEAVGEAGEAMMTGKRQAEKAALEKKKVEDEAAYRDKYIGALTQKDETAGHRFALEALTKASQTAEREIEKTLNSAEYATKYMNNPVAWAQKQAEIEAKHLRNAQKFVKSITGKDYDFSDMGAGPAQATFTLQPGKGLVRN